VTIRLYAGSYELETIDRPNRIKSPRQDEAAQARYIHVDVTPIDRALWITATASDSGKQIWIDVHFTTRMLAALGNPAWNDGWPRQSVIPRHRGSTSPSTRSSHPAGMRRGRVAGPTIRVRGRHVTH